MQNENKANDKRMKILQAAGIFDASKNIKEQFETLEPKYIDFDSGKLLTGSSLEEFLSKHKVITIKLLQQETATILNLFQLQKTLLLLKIEKMLANSIYCEMKITLLTK